MGYAAARLVRLIRTDEGASLPRITQEKDMKFSRYVAAASLALAAVGTATVAHAGGNVQYSVGAHVIPGVTIGVTNAPVYYPRPVYAPYYVPPAPVYYAPPPVVYVPRAPVYYGAYYGAAPVYYNRPHSNHHRHHSHRGHNRHWK
jgi:hypothetical protein